MSFTERGIRRRYKIALIVVIAGLPFVVTGARQAVEGMRVAPERWISPAHPERARFDKFREQFEGNDLVLLAWDGCTLDDPRLPEFERAVLSSEGNSPTNREYDRVVTGESSLRRLMAPPVNLSRQQAIDRLTGLLVGPDGQTTCALVVLTYEGNDRRDESIERLKVIAQEVTGLDRDRIRVAGPPHDGVAIDRESVRGVNVFSTLCTLTAAIICVLCLRSWRLTGVIIGIACFGQGVSLALIHYSGLTLDAILIVVPPLIFILTVSAGVHLANYYAEAVHNPEGENPVVAALRTGWKPCLLAIVTTAVGLCSLAVSVVAPVFIFGLISAVSLLATTAILLAILPGELLLHPYTSRPLSSPETPARLRRTDPRFAGSRWLVAVCLTAMIVSAAGLQRLATSVDALSLFSPKSRIARDYHWFEANIGAVVPVEVVVEFATDHPLGFRRRVELIERVHRAVDSVAGISGTVSALTFSPEIPSGNDRRSFWRAGTIYGRIHSNRDQLIAEHYLFEDSQRQCWRITGHVSATKGTDYAEIREKLTAATAPLVASNDEFAGVEIRSTGMMPLIQYIQTTILEDLFRSFLTAFVLIAVAIAIVLRNVRLTLAAMLPNLFPILIIFGGMGWLNIPADIGTVMTASVALGIAVDDTLHFLTSYRRGLRTGMNNETAVRFAMSQCGRAMLQTTVICAVGMLIFTFSDFVPTFRFGLVMALSLLAALIGDLIFLPALLVSPLGRWLTATQTARQRDPDPPAKKPSKLSNLSSPAIYKSSE